MRVKQEAARAWAMRSEEEERARKTMTEQEGESEMAGQAYEEREEDMLRVIERLTGQNQQLLETFLQEKARSNRIQEQLLAAKARKRAEEERQQRVEGEARRLRQEVMLAQKLVSSLSDMARESLRQQREREEALLSWIHLLEEQASESTGMLDKMQRKVVKLEGSLAGLQASRKEGEEQEKKEEERLRMLEKLTAQQQRKIQILSKHKQESERLLRTSMEGLVQRLQLGEEEKSCVGEETSPPRPWTSPPRAAMMSRRRDGYTAKTYEEMRRGKEEAERRLKLASWRLKQLAAEHAIGCDKLAVTEAERDEVKQEGAEEGREKEE